MNKEILRILIDKIGRETVDRFIEDEGGSLARVKTISLEVVAEEIADALIEQGYHTNDNSTIKVYSFSVLMKQPKAWLVDQVRLLEKLHQDDEWQIDQQAKNCEKLLSEKDRRIQELETELSHREEDLVHADEKVFYRETAVKLEEDKIKQQAVREFAEKLKIDLREEELNSTQYLACVRVIDYLFKEVTV